MSVELLKLEKVDIQGVRGNAQGTMVISIYQQCLELIKMFAECKYDAIDTEDKVRNSHFDTFHSCSLSPKTLGCVDQSASVPQTFDENFQLFQEQIVDFERRLGTILCQAFDDCPSTESAVKVRPCRTGLYRPQRPTVVLPIVGIDGKQEFIDK